MTIALRPMTSQDISLGMHLVAQAGWNQVESDWRMILNSSQGGSFVAYVQGVDVGTVTTITYPPNLGWIGMMLVDPSYRRRGVGTSLLTAAIDAAKTIPSLWLDATPQGIRLYEKLDFKAEYGLTRMIRSLPVPVEGEQKGCRLLSSGDFSQVVRLDQSVFSVDRQAILSAILHDHPGLACGFDLDGRLLGFCLGRRGRLYDHIGPLIAEDQYIAQHLLRYRLSQIVSRPVILDVPDFDREWIGWLEAAGFERLRPLTRMCRGNPRLNTRLSQYFAIAGPELG